MARHLDATIRVRVTTAERERWHRKWCTPLTTGWRAGQRCRPPTRRPRGGGLPRASLTGMWRANLLDEVGVAAFRLASRTPPEVSHPNNSWPSGAGHPAELKRS